MVKNILEKIAESLRSVLPISAIVLLIHFTIAPLPGSTLAFFLTGTLLLVVGMGIFTIGSDTAMLAIGRTMGAKLTESRSLPLLIAGSFLLGLIVTVAEPDLQVLTKQVPSVPDAVLIGAVAVGVGFFLVVAVLRIIFQIRLSRVFWVSYGLIGVVALLVSQDYLAVGFDSGGVTTGPITVPFILAIGVGVSAVTNSKNPENDSFGLCAICSIGPILTVLIMGIFYPASETDYALEAPVAISSASELIRVYANGLLSFSKEVLTAMAPISIIFTLCQIFSFKLPASQVWRIAVGVVYTVVGLTIFLTGVNIGFMPSGTYIGYAIAKLDYNWILIPISVAMGFFVVAAEPAVYVLNQQVEEVTGGAISRRTMMTGLSAGVGAALAFAMIRIMTGLPIWIFLLGGYGAALLLTLFVPQFFTAIAFDSGGVASGTMAAAFLLPFAVGVSDALGGNMMTDAFGIVAMVAMMPLVSIQILGLLYRIKTEKMKKTGGDANA